MIENSIHIQQEVLGFVNFLSLKDMHSNSKP